MGLVPGKGTRAAAEAAAAAEECRTIGIGAASPLAKASARPDDGAGCCWLSRCRCCC